MYDANTRAAYAEMFKVAQQLLPASVREQLVKAAANDLPVQAALRINKETR